MISARSKFRIVKRGFEKTIVLVPGWATDYKIFDTLDLKYNYILPIDINFIDFKYSLLKFLEASSVERVSLFGWSQGGFLASDFASHNTEKIDELILAGIRKRYDQNTLEEIRCKLKQNKRAFLYKFYLNCFSQYDNKACGWFKRSLLKKYLDQMNVEYLLCGLDYLSCARIKAEFLSGVKMIRIFHGAQDKIASLDEALEIKSCLSHAQFIVLDRLGHLLFLNPDFRKKFNG
ncbi:MAG: alpha/beta fold hydrolase [Candidatus Omnitrophota bacterium]